MVKKVLNYLWGATCLILAISTVSFSQDPARMKDAANESEKAAEALREIMNTPDRRFQRTSSTKLNALPCFLLR